MFFDYGNRGYGCSEKGDKIVEWCDESATKKGYECTGLEDERTRFYQRASVVERLVAGLIFGLKHQRNDQIHRYIA